MNNHKKYFILIFLTVLYLYSYSQDKWSLEKCIDYAIKNNIQLKQQELNSSVSKNNERQSALSFLPSINANANHSINYGRKVDAFTNEFTTSKASSDNFSFVSSLTLFNGLKNINTYRQSQYNFLASIQDLEKAKNDLSLNIAASYLQILFNEELLAIAKSQSNVTKQQVDRYKLLFNEGSISKDKLLEIESQFASQNYQVVVSENQLNLSYLTLTQLLDIDSVQNFKIETPQLSAPDDITVMLNINQIYQQSLEKLPQIKSAEFKLKATERGYALAKGMISPTLSVNGSIGSGYSDAKKTIAGASITGYELSGYTDATGTMLNIYSPNVSYDYKTRAFQDQLKDNMNKSLYFSLNIPIFNGWQAGTNISNAKINLINSEYNLTTAKKQLFKDIQQAYADALASYNKYNAAKKSVDAIQESFEFTQKKYDVGMVNFVDYNVAVNNLTKAKSDLLQSKYEYIFKIKILDFYRGNPIKL